MINTVNGKIKREDLKIVSAHEHIFIDMRKCVDISGGEPPIFYSPFDVKNRSEIVSDPYAILDNALLEGVDDAVFELEDFYKSGGRTVVDCTLDEIGRDPLAMREISLKTGVNIILGCGHYYHKAHFPYVKDASVDALADEMRKDIFVGIGGTDIKSGVIGEIGTSAVVSGDEKKALKAAGVVGAESGLGVHVHTDLYTENGFLVADILQNEGVKPNKICIDHVDVLLRPDYIKKLLKRGVYVEFDNFGKEFYLSEKKRFAYDLERVKLLKELIDEGYGDRLLISNDICLKSMWKTYGGNGYSHILKAVKFMAEENGVPESVYLKILTENPAEFLDA
ncbi:MAG: hypothetical protein IJ800_06905 [Clostridia bacterium]|nr:hypothetical protein [Clostridia bacterium]